MIKVGSDFSGVGAFNQALIRLGVEYKEVFACDMDKYARQTFIHNYGEPDYFPTNVYDRVIPEEPLDIYMTSPPCQAFSLAGKRKGKDDMRGILFFNSLEFIRINKPRYFIFENVKGLLSDDNGKTFSEWVNLLAGKSVNGAPVIFPYDDSVPYHLYWQVLNAKHHGVPQNRERVFLVGIRDDKDNTFRFPPEEHLIKGLKDVLDEEVEEKYYLSSKMVQTLEAKNFQDNGFTFNPKSGDNISSCVTARYFKMGASDNYLKVGTWRTHEDGRGFREVEDGNCPTIPARAREDGSGQHVVIGAFRGRNPDNPSDRTTGAPTQQRLEINESGTSNTITTVTKDNIVIQLNPSKESGGQQPYQQNRIYDPNGVSPALNAGQETWGGNAIIIDNTNDFDETDPRVYDKYAPSIRSEMHGLQTINNYRIRRLTPRECFRLLDFPESFTWICSDSQAYKQAGNSIVVNVLYKIIKNLNIAVDK